MEASGKVPNVGGFGAIGPVSTVAGVARGPSRAGGFCVWSALTFDQVPPVARSVSVALPLILRRGAFSVGLVRQAILPPASQLRQELRALGWDHEQAVTIISDGEPALPNLVRNAVGGKVRHILDWWHISMHIQPVENAVKGPLQSRSLSGIPVPFKRPAKTLRWYLWHGIVLTATTSLQWMRVDCARLVTDDRVETEAARRVQVRCRDLYSYLANNMDSLTDYGRRYRTGLPSSSSRAEGCVGDIGNTRMGKRRRM
ncbi:hypothetical protein SAMN04488105_10715 [Salipiger thiooxidans]|uniref:Uncharacterized protein n=1 Tax=Salipiger thiooxidans TaxID=282683 RepID=A0A1G7FE86_9RHOB|nr:hypothetical protein SAMN04488105_10715 [Salipiger thiooxidans]